jgi:hypothetical protein
VARTLEIARAIGGHDYVEARVAKLPPERLRNLDVVPTPLFDTLGADPPVDRVTKTEVDGEPVLAYYVQSRSRLAAKPRC